MSSPTVPDLHRRIAALRERGPVELAGKVVTVMSGKGGVGKTLIAMELAYLFDAVLVDLDWDGGRASRALGFQHTKYQRIPLLDALDSGRTPTPKKMTRRPDLVPGHPDFGARQPAPAYLAEQLSRWAVDLKRPLVTDTHPGGSDSTFGALGAADVVVHPIALATRELDALEETLAELEQYPIILIPNEVPTYVPGPELERLAQLAEKHQVTVGPFISEYDAYRRRKLRTVVTAASDFGKRPAQMAAQLVDVAEGVLTYAAA
ncbi:ParA family protein [Actinosynnema sp. NPDC059335]|uniref:ParA family protein n=1 Tax=Actinosynnema sp. NPDC059335 TaxID=3346804 RepID=UPI0036734180